MKLYYTPGVCSLAAHIYLRELGLSFTLERIDLMTKRTQSGLDYLSINPKGYVPTLEVEGDRLTENVAILQYLNDFGPKRTQDKVLDRYRLLEWLAFINSELHKGHAPFFAADVSEAEKTRVREKLRQRLSYTEGRVRDLQYLVGNAFGVADAYLYTVLTWTGGVGLPLDQWPVLRAYCSRIGERPSVIASHQAEAET
jgi:glutathione S-transferase